MDIILGQTEQTKGLSYYDDLSFGFKYSIAFDNSCLDKAIRVNGYYYQDLRHGI